MSSVYKIVGLFLGFFHIIVAMLISTGDYEPSKQSIVFAYCLAGLGLILATNRIKGDK